MGEGRRITKMQTRSVASDDLRRSGKTTNAGVTIRPRLRSKPVDVIVEEVKEGEREVVDRRSNPSDKCVSMNRSSVFIQARKDTDESYMRACLNTLVTGLSFLRLNDDEDNNVDDNDDLRVMEDQIRYLYQTPKVCTETGLKYLHRVLDSLTMRTKRMNMMEVSEEGKDVGTVETRSVRKACESHNKHAVRLACTAVAALKCVRSFTSLLSLCSVPTSLPLQKRVAIQLVLVLDCIETAISRLTKAWYDNGRPDQGLGVESRRAVITVRSARAKILNTSTVSPVDLVHAQAENAAKNSERGERGTRKEGCPTKAIGCSAGPTVERTVELTVKPVEEFSVGSTVGSAVGSTLGSRRTVVVKPGQSIVRCGEPAKLQKRRATVRFDPEIVTVSHSPRVPYANIRAIFEDVGLVRADEAALEGLQERVSKLTFGSFHSLYGVIRKVVLRLEQEANRRESIELHVGGHGTNAGQGERRDDQGTIVANRQDDEMSAENSRATRAIPGTNNQRGDVVPIGDQVPLAYCDEAVFRWLLAGTPHPTKALKRRLDAAKGVNNKNQGGLRS